MEDKPPFLVPKMVYYIIIAVYFCQLSGYFFSTQETKELIEQKARFIGLINEMSSGTYLLYYKAQDNMTLIAFSFFQISMYFYYLYVAFYTYLRTCKKQWLDKHSPFFQMINQYLNIVFTFFWWIFLTPYLEINNAFLSCSQYSFLVSMRNTDCTKVNPAIRVFGILGFLFTFITALISVFLFRNNEFMQKDYLRRKFSHIQTLTLICRAALIFIYYMDLDQILILKEILMSLLIVLFVIDIYLNKPYYNQEIMKMYACSVASFLAGIIVIAFYNNTDQMQDTQVFYYFVMLVVLFSSAFIAYLNFSYEKIIRFNSINFKEQIIQQFLNQ